MRTTIDKAGRLVLPKQLRDRVGMSAGEVDLLVDTSVAVPLIVGDHTITRPSRERWTGDSSGSLVMRRSRHSPC